MKIKVSEATPLQLNWLVTQCEGVDLSGKDRSAATNFLIECKCQRKHRYSTDWSQGGPLLEREIARLEDLGDEGWEACGYGFTATGPTPLIAAMRCYCASKLGDEVEIPDELLGD